MLLWGQLNHQNIIQAFGIDITSFPDTPCIVTPYIEPRFNVMQFMSSYRPIPIKEDLKKIWVRESEVNSLNREKKTDW